MASVCLLVIVEFYSLIRDIAATKEIADHVTSRRSGLSKDLHGTGVVFLRRRCH
jgi:hypothetical protein